MNPDFTIFGHRGFIGRHLVQKLQDYGYAVEVIQDVSDLEKRREIGCLVYCVGVTADFRTRPHAALEAHIGLLLEVLERERTKSLVYLSSTRIYRDSDSTAESASLVVNPLDIDDVYNISKLAGETAVLSLTYPGAKVVRLSNVYGYDPDSPNFLPEVIRSAIKEKNVRLGLSADSEKDFVSIDDVCELIPRIATDGRERLYNVASGQNVRVGLIMERLHDLTGCSVGYGPQSSARGYPQIDISRLTKEFAFKPRQLVEDLESLVAQYSLETV